MRVQLVYAGAQRQVLEVQLDLAAEVSIEQALPDVADVLGEDVVAQIRDGGLEAGVWGAVSYTHLTLPTSDLV